MSISGTDDSTLYQTQRLGMTAYTVAVPNGQYTVILHFAETAATISGPGQRVFGLSIQGTPLGNLDVFAQAGGRNHAISKTAVVSVTDGAVRVAFTPVVGTPMIDALEVLPAPPRFTSTASVSPAQGTLGAPVVIQASVTSATPATAILDVEVYDASGHRAYQLATNARTFSAGQALSTSGTWGVPTSAVPGSYTVKLGVFSADWSALYNWNDTAATITVAANVAPTATSAPPTATAVPPTPTSAYSRAVLADQPLAFWHLDETSGTSAADSSGHGSTATINGGVTLGVTGPSGAGSAKAMTFDGQTGFVHDNSALAVGSDFSIEAWVKASSATQDTPIVALVGPQDQGARVLYLSGQQLRGMDDVSGNWPTYSVATTSPLDTTTWHHVVFTTQGGTNLALYVDGVLASSASVPAVASFSGTPVLSWSDEQAFKKYAGSLSQVAVYAVALSANQVRAHFVANAGPAPAPTPVPPIATAVPPTASPVPPTATVVPPTASPAPPTATVVPPTATVVPPTATAVPPTATVVPPTPTSAYSRAVLADQPLAFWHLDETSGTSAADSSGHGSTATINGGVTLGVTGPSGAGSPKAMTFDGQTGFVRDNSALAVGSDFSIEAWVKASSATQDTPIVALVGPQDQGARVLYLSGQQYRGMDDVGPNWPTYAISGSIVNPTMWHHVVFTTQAGANLALYVDGVLANSSTIPAVAAFSGNPVLSWSDEQAFKKFSGSLDDVAVYAVALSAARVKAHYAANGGLPPAPTAVPTTATAVPPTATAAPVVCTGTLQSLIDGAAAGSTLKVPACIYRESITINKSLTVDGQGNAEIRGSDVWTGWTQSGATWISTNTVPNLGPDSAGSVYTDQFLASHLEQVFNDGIPLTQVPSSPSSTQFALDGSRHVVLATNPASHLLEVTTRKFWVYTVADNVTITNLKFHHAATASQEHAIGNDDRANFVLSNSVLTDAHGTLLSLGGGDLYSRILNNTFSNAGELAIGSYLSGHALIQGNTLSQNGWGGWDPQWQAGAIKTVTSTNLTVDSNTVYGNNGPGIWCDIACQTVTYSNNKTHDNTGPGLMFEISTGVHIFGNSVWNTGGNMPGIFISSSGGAEVNANYVYNSQPGILVYLDNRSDQKPLTNNYVHDNYIIMTADGQTSLGFGDYGNNQSSSPSANNHGSNNAFWYPSAETGQQRFRYGNIFAGSLSAFAATAGGTTSRYVSDAEKTQALTQAGITP